MAFRRLLDEQSPIIFSLLQRMVFDRSEHEDIAQEIFVKIAQNIASFKGDSKLSTWIYTIAYRHILDHLKKNRRDIIQKSKPIEDYHSLEAEDEETEGDVDIKRLLGKLDKKYRIYVEMKYIDNRSLKEMADITGLSLGAVKTRIHRGIKELRNYLT
ncbi:MAG: RNA polymerase sigma factor [Candidatus Zixiibacteriota bacterium]